MGPSFFWRALSICASAERPGIYPGEPEAFMNSNEQDYGPIGGLLCVMLALVLMLII
jgi:hypothetical protein